MLASGISPCVNSAAILTGVKELAATADAKELAKLAATQRYLVDESEVSYGVVGTDGLE